MEPEEYTVESISQARVEKSKRKLIWKYRVKWQGYGPEEDTWEPKESFTDGAEDLLNQFWLRVDTNGRDPYDMDLFRAGEQVLAAGPRRMKGRKPKARLEEEKKLEEPRVMQENSSKRDRSPSQSSEKEEEGPPTKRIRGRASSPKTRDFPSKNQNRSTRASTSRQRKSSNVPNRSLSRRGRQQSPIEIHTESENEVIRDLVTSQKNKNGGFPPQEVPPSDDERDAEGLTDPLFGGGDSDVVVAEEEVSPSIDEDRSMTPPKPASPTSPAVAAAGVKAHHKKPLVKMMDDPGLSSVDNAIPTKARLMERHETGDEDSPSRPETSSISASNSIKPARGGKTKKPGPGRNSAGMKISKNTSSLLTFNKGELKTVKRKNPPPSPPKEEQPKEDEVAPNGVDDLTEVPPQAMDVDVPPQTTDVDALEAVPQTMDVDASAAPAVNPDPAPAVPTPQELLNDAGLIEEVANALPDFEEAIIEPVVDPEVLQRSVEVANSLFPSTSTSVLVPTQLTREWAMPSIFGAHGHSQSSVSSASKGPNDQSSLSCRLDLSSTVSLPIVFNEVHPSASGFPDLATVLSKNSTGPPGKFYAAEHIPALIATIRTGGPSALVSLDPVAVEGDKKHFERFTERLAAGNLFFAVLGPENFVFCASGNSELANRLNPPRELVGREGCVLASRIEIENFSAFAAAAENADNTTW